jgi:hypothetical protein
MSDNDIKVRRIKCKCGKARLLSVIDPEGKPLSKDAWKQQSELLKLGLEVDSITLPEARKQELCFDCKL